MKSVLINLTIFLALITLTGCASLFGDPPDDSDNTQFSQSAPERPEGLDPSSEDYHRTYVNRAIQTRDIVPGMTQQEVISAWGRPREVDVAGDGSRGNERWSYFTDNSTLYGISRQRIVYFDGGRVTGWETR